MNILKASNVEEIISCLKEQDYLANEGLATAIFLALRLKKPLLLEGEAGVGKTEVAKALSASINSEMIRLQCYEGIDASQAVYEWDYAKQLLHLRASEVTGLASEIDLELLEGEIYDEKFLIRRPLMRALEPAELPPVLLIDEVDRADDEFEAFLLEVLSDYSITVPEIGTFKTENPPLVIITSNRTRDVHDALKRRCLYHWVEHPGIDQEVEILRVRAPHVPLSLARDVAEIASELRNMDLYKPPGVSETIDWVEALVTVGADEIEPDALDSTLGALLKYREDQQRVRNRGFGDVLAAVRQG